MAQGPLTRQVLGLGANNQPGGGYVAAIVITKNGKPIRSATAFNHFSMLATIEDGFDLPRLANAKTAKTMFELISKSERSADRDDDKH